MEYCNTYGILKYCSIKDHLRMQQRELGSVLGLGVWRALSYLCILQSWSGLGTAAARRSAAAAVANSRERTNLGQLRICLLCISNFHQNFTLSRHLAPIPSTDNYIFLTWIYSNNTFTCLKFIYWCMFWKIVIFREAGSCFQRIKKIKIICFFLLTFNIK